MLVYGAIGDAYGAAFEFLAKERFHPNLGTHFFVQPDTNLGNGYYTDDTQMSIAIIEVMLKHNPSNITKTILADSFVSTYHNDPRPGYASGFKNLLEACETGDQLIYRLGEVSSTRSGAIMRAAPIGGYKNINDVKRIAALQASITHSGIAIECAVAIALAMHYVIHSLGSRYLIGEFLNDHIDGSFGIDWREDRETWATVEAVDCARNAITAWRNSFTTTEVLRRAIAPGGDTDTVASVAMQLAWATSGIKDDTSLDLINDLETGRFGFEYLFDLTHKYVGKFMI